MTEPLLESPTTPGAETPHQPPQWQMLGLAIGLNLLWAFSYPISKLLIGDLSHMALSCWRIGGATLMLLPFLKREDIPSVFGWRDLLLLLIMGLIGCGGAIALQYAGTAHTTAANVSLLVGLETSIVVLLAAVFLGEAITRRDLLSLILAFFGVILLSVDPSSLDLLNSQHLKGNLLVLGSIFGYSAYTIAGKLLVGRWGATAVTVLPFALASLAFIPAFAWYDPPAWNRALALTSREILGVLFLAGVVTAMGYLGWNWLLRWMPAGKLAFFLYLQPPAGALFSIWLLGEPLNPTFILGGSIILIAMLLSHRPHNSPARPDPITTG